MAFQHGPTLQSTGRLLLTPPLTWFLRMLACAYLSLTKYRFRLPHYVEATESWLNRFLISVCFVCHLGSITAASGRFLSFRLPNRGDIVPSGLLGVRLPSVYHPRFRSPSFVQVT